MGFKKFANKYLRKRMTIVVLDMVLIPLLSKWGFDNETILAIQGVVASYLLGQSASDIMAEKNKRPVVPDSK